MNDIYNALAASLAFDNDILPSVATQVVTWLDREGVLDDEILNETYVGNSDVQN